MSQAAHIGKGRAHHCAPNVQYLLPLLGVGAFPLDVCAGNPASQSHTFLLETTWRLWRPCGAGLPLEVLVNCAGAERSALPGPHGRQHVPHGEHEREDGGEGQHW